MPTNAVWYRRTPGIVNPATSRPILHLRLLIKLHIVGREETRRSLVVSKPPVLIRKVQVGDGSALWEAQFCTRSISFTTRKTGEMYGMCQCLPLSSAAS